MASPNRHWPSMFRSNLACNIQQQQQHHPDMNGNGNGGGSSSPSFLLSAPPASSGKPSLISSGCEEGTRNPEAKPRWNPRPEQIRILEGIFNSGMVNPPRDEIRRIRLQLQEYGHVGDANVFYWFQNRKSRTKNKLRAAGHLPAHHHGRAALSRAFAATPMSSAAPAPPVTPPRHLLATAPTSSSSSSSDRSSGSSNKSVKPAAATAMDLFSPAPAPPAQLYYHHSHPTPPTPTPLARDQLITSPESPSLFLLWPAAAASQYMPATELSGVLSSHMNTPAISPAGVLLGLCNEAALGQQHQQEIMDHADMISSSTKEGFDNYMNIIKNDDAVSAVIKDDETARLGSLHYGVTAAAANPVPRHHHHQQHHLASPVHAAVEASTAMLPFTTAATTTTPSSNVVATNSALADQLQGLLDAGSLLQGGGAAPQPSATVVAVSRDAVTMCVKTTSYSFPAMMHLNVKMFGEAAVLVRNSGETVLVDGSGVTVEPLQQGAIYYVLATEDAVQWSN